MPTYYVEVRADYACEADELIDELVGWSDGVELLHEDTMHADYALYVFKLRLGKGDELDDAMSDLEDYIIDWQRIDEPVENAVADDESESEWDKKLKDSEFANAATALTRRHFSEIDALKTEIETLKSQKEDFRKLAWDAAIELAGMRAERQRLEKQLEQVERKDGAIMLLHVLLAMAGVSAFVILFSAGL